MPVDAAVDVERVATAGPDHEAHRQARVRLVLLEGDVRPRVREGARVQRVDTSGRCPRPGEQRVVRRMDRGGVVPRHHAHQLAGAGHLGLDPAGDPRLHVALAAGDVAVGADVVGAQLRRHRVAAAAEVRGLGPLDHRDAGERDDAATGPQHQQQREQAGPGARQAKAPAAEVERVPAPATLGRLGGGRLVAGRVVRRLTRRGRLPVGVVRVAHRAPQFMMAATARAMSSLARAPIRTSRTFPSGPMKKWVGMPMER